MLHDCFPSFSAQIYTGIVIIRHTHRPILRVIIFVQGQLYVTTNVAPWFATSMDSIGFFSDGKDVGNRLLERFCHPFGLESIYILSSAILPTFSVSPFSVATFIVEKSLITFLSSFQSIFFFANISGRR